MANRLLRWFDFSHYRTERAKEIAMHCKTTANIMDAELNESAEKTAGLRKLLEAKDCFVRAVIEQDHPAPDPD